MIEVVLSPKRLVVPGPMSVVDSARDMEDGMGE